MAAEVANSDLEFALSEKSESVLQAVIKEKKATTTQQDELFADIDGPTFDCTAFVNKLLPNPASLEKLPEYLGRLDIQIEALDKEIRSGIHEAACSRARTKSTLSKTREVVSELFTKINTISTKCQKSQQLVADICSDIRVLDTAKKNLTSTITALKRLHMLSSAASQLKTASNQRDFARAANLLEAVQALEIHFSNVKDVAKLTELTKKTQECRDSLRAAVFEVFGAAGAGAVENRKLLGEACSVVAVLGIECRTALIESVIRRQLEPYKVIFTPSEISGSGQVEDACFENTDRRYAWFKRQIRIFSERFRGIYPKGWNVAGLLALEFCSITNQHLKILLKNISREDVPDVALIVKVLTQTITFEKDLQRHYSNETPESTDNEDSESSIDNQKASDHEDSFRSHFKSVGTSRMEVLNEVTRVHFFGVISSCFQPFMGYYVTLEQQNMDELLKTLITTETWVLTEPITTSLQRYKGSDQIFLYIKNSMKRCLHLGQIELLTDVQQVYFAGLKNFCSLLESRSKELLISDTTSAPVAPPNASAIVSPVQDLTHLQLQSLGILINTAEYCSETLPQLQESISKAISQDIDCSSSQERFDALISKTIEDIISIMMLQSEKILTAMARLPLASLDAVGDTSQYVQQLKALFQDKTSSISAVLSPSYHHVFCNRLVANFLPKYMFSIIRCKRINDFGAQQLLLDTEALKTILLGLPSLGSDKQSDLDAAKKRPPKSYTTILLKQIGKTEAILKTLSASTDTLAETYSTLLPNGNQIDLIRIMDLKGIKKVDQQAVVKTYNNICPAQHQSEPLFKDDGSKKFYLF